jgi:hypothetical protein
MNVTVVESTTLSKIAYDYARRLLELEFRSGASYQYFGVPADVYEALLRADSKGRYFNQAIRGWFPYRLVPNVNADALDAGVRAAWRK